MPEAGYVRSINLRDTKTVGKRGRHTLISNKAQTVVRIEKTLMMQGRSKGESIMTEVEVCISADVAKRISRVITVLNLQLRQYENAQPG